MAAQRAEIGPVSHFEGALVGIPDHVPATSRTEVKRTFPVKVNGKEIFRSHTVTILEFRRKQPSSGNATAQTES